MSSSIIDSTGTETVAPTPTGAGEHAHHTMPRTWLVVVAVVAAATLGLTLAWQATAGASPASPPSSSAPAASTTTAVPALSRGAGLLATAWELAPTSQRRAACAEFAADPAAAWAAFSAAADASSIATRAEFSAFLAVSC